MDYVAYVLAVAAILMMGLNTYLALRLKRAIIGGEVGQKWGLLTILIGVFFIGYLFSPLAIYFQVPVRYLNLLVFGVFLFGAVFVYVVMGIIREALSFLKLMK